MYYMYMGRMQIPIPPPSMQTKIKNRNKTIELLETGEVNIIKSAGLSEISFRIMLPNSSYPFSQGVSGGFIGSLLGFGSSGQAPGLLNSLEQMKTSKQPFQFIVVRLKESGKFINLMNMKVTLEEYTIEEDADEGYDMYASVKLKKYVSWGAKKLVMSTDENGQQTATPQGQRSTTGHTVPTSFTIGKNQTLAQAMKFALGSVQNLKAVKELNKIVIPAVLSEGTVIHTMTPQEGMKIPGIVMH